MNIIIQRFNDNFTEKPYLCLRYFSNSIKLSIEDYSHHNGAFSVGNMACFAIKEVDINRYETYNNMLFYAGSIVHKIVNNADCSDICLDWLDFADFAVKVNLWLANH